MLNIATDMDPTFSRKRVFPDLNTSVIYELQKVNISLTLIIMKGCIDALLLCYECWTCSVTLGNYIGPKKIIEK